MTPFRLLLLFLLLWGGSASRPHVDAHRFPASLDCLREGIWGNDWPICGIDPTPTAKGRGDQEQRLAQELKLTVRADGTGEMSFYFCPTKKRIPNPVKFTYSLEKDRLKFNWLGTKYETWLISEAFNYKTSFKATCSQDTLFVDSLMQNTLYQGATYFIRRK